MNAGIDLDSDCRNKRRDRLATAIHLERAEALGMAENDRQHCGPVDDDRHGSKATKAVARIEPAVAALALPIGDVKVSGVRIRSLDPRHVLDLAESIAAIGLIQPPVVDRNYVLIAGGHRLAALRLLTSETPAEAVREWRALSGPSTTKILVDGERRVRALGRTRFRERCIPVDLIDIDTASEPERAVVLELAENEKRRNYTPAEARAIADKLRAAGYQDHRGRPVDGKQPLHPALALILGRTTRSVRRLLAASGAAKRDRQRPGKTRIDEPRRKAAMRLARSATEFIRVADPRNPSDQRLVGSLRLTMLELFKITDPVITTTGTGST